MPLLTVFLGYAQFHIFCQGLISSWIEALCHWVGRESIFFSSVYSGSIRLSRYVILFLFVWSYSMRSHWKMCFSFHQEVCWPLQGVLM